MKTPGGRISALRTAAKLSQADLARASRITQSHISQIERGKRVPNMGTLRALAHALGASVGDIVDG